MSMYINYNYMYMCESICLERIFLYEIDYYKCLLFGVKNFTIEKIVTIFNKNLVFNCNIIAL